MAYAVLPSLSTPADVASAPVTLLRAYIDAASQKRTFITEVSQYPNVSRWQWIQLTLKAKEILVRLLAGAVSLRWPKLIQG